MDKDVYSLMPDFSVHLTANGTLQSHDCAERVSQMCGLQFYSERMIFYVSPYVRTLQTAEAFKQKFVGARFFEDARIREIEMSNGGLIDESAVEQIAEARAKGRFFYRIPGGENGAAVYDRCASFYHTMKEDQKTYSPSYQIVITHAYTMRVIRCVMERLPCSYVDTAKRPGNCEIWEIYEK